jgi:hypothetical protein
LYKLIEDVLGLKLQARFFQDTGGVKHCLIFVHQSVQGFSMSGCVLCLKLVIHPVTTAVVLAFPCSD